MKKGIFFLKAVDHCDKANCMLPKLFAVVNIIFAYLFLWS